MEARTWYEHRLDLERRRLMTEGKPPAEGQQRGKSEVLRELYTLIT